MAGKSLLSPFFIPVLAFAATIVLGSFVLWLDVSAAGTPVAYVDALFIATSAVCVTGLASVDPSTVFNRTGQSVLLLLIQLGGLGISTYTTLIFYLWSKRISLTDKIAVGEMVLLDSSFHLGRFLQRIILIIFGLECLGALLLYSMHQKDINVFHAIFLSVSAFCNAGFALCPDNLIQWRSHWGVNGVIMGLVICGGLGFFVLDETLRVGAGKLRWYVRKVSGKILPLAPGLKPSLSYHSKLVLQTSIGLILGGGVVLFVGSIGTSVTDGVTLADSFLPSLFHSVSARTAGFATIDMAQLHDHSLLFLILLMFIGGSPGSCAGGIKTTTFRALVGFVAAQVKGTKQVWVQGRALSARTMSKVMVLLSFSVLTIFSATLLLTFTENGRVIHASSPVQVLDIFFEVVSAFGTVGLSVNITPQLSVAGKLIICLVMFIGRLGPIWLITSVQQLVTEPLYRLPETDIPIG